MGRPSKLTPAQWEEVRKRLLQGETPGALAKAFGVSDTAIRKKFGTNSSVSSESLSVRETAETLAAGQRMLEALPAAHRPAAMDLAELLRSTSMSLGRAAELGAKNSHRLQHMANTALQRVDDDKPLTDEDSVAALKAVATLTKMANDAAHIPVNLLNANKERITRMDEAAEGGETQQGGVLVVPGLATSSEAWSKTARGGEKE